MIWGWLQETLDGMEFENYDDYEAFIKTSIDNQAAEFGRAERYLLQRDPRVWGEFNVSIKEGAKK